MTQLDRIEKKLDALIAALAQDADDSAPIYDLEGGLIPQERDPTETL